MALGPSQANSRANSDLLSIRIIAEDVSVSAVERMAAIAAISERYADSVRFDSGNMHGEPEARKRWPWVFVGGVK